MVEWFNGLGLRLLDQYEALQLSLYDRETRPLKGERRSLIKDRGRRKRMRCYKVENLSFKRNIHLTLLINELRYRFKKYDLI